MNNTTLTIYEAEIKKIIADYYHVPAEQVSIEHYTETEGRGMAECEVPKVLVEVKNPPVKQ